MLHLVTGENFQFYVAWFARVCVRVCACWPKLLLTANNWSMKKVLGKTFTGGVREAARAKVNATVRVVMLIVDDNVNTLVILAH